MSNKIDYACPMSKKASKIRAPSFIEGAKKMIVTVRTDEALVRRARRYGVNISRTLHDALSDHVAALDNQHGKKGKAA